MKGDILEYIVSQAKANSLDSIPEEKIKELVETTERELGISLTGYATIDKPYNQYYTEDMLSGFFPKGKISSIILEKASQIPDTVAFRCERNFTYQELYDETLKYAYILKNNYNIQSGDNIIMDVLSTPDAICAFLAANLLGAKVRPIDPVYSVDQIHKILQEYNPKMVICNALHYKNMKKSIGDEHIPVSYIKLKGNLPFLPSSKKQLINMLESLNEWQIKRDGNFDWKSFHGEVADVDLSEVSLDGISPPYVPNEIAAIFPTSGTTGEAKGVEVTNENFLSNVYKEFSSDFDIKKEDSLFNPMPTSSSFFWYTIALAAFLGVTTSLSPLFDAKSSPKQIGIDESTWVLLGPIIIEKLCNYVEKTDKFDSSFYELVLKLQNLLWGYDSKSITTSIRGKSHYISGGDLLSLDLERRAKANGLVINNNLGTSENTGPSTNPNGAMKNGRGYYEGSVGVSLPGNDMAIFRFDEENSLPAIGSEDYEKGLKYYEVGEICFSCNNPNVFSDYYNNPNATSQAKLRHADGSMWYHSGDLGYMDPAGHVFCCGRKNGLIVRNGHKVWSSKIERVAKSITGIQDCAIIGVPNEAEKEVPACFIVFEDDVNDQQKKSIMNQFYSEIASQLDVLHIPTFWKELDVIPRNMMTKAKIGELREIYNQSAENESKKPMNMKDYFKKFVKRI